MKFISTAKYYLSRYNIVGRGAILKYGYQGSAEANLGDFIAVYLWKRLFGRPRTDVSRSWMYVIGSVLDAAYIKPALARRKGVHFWSCGLRDSSKQECMFDPSVRIYGVRGPLSAQTLGDKELFVGDSALLLPLIYPGKLDPTFESKTILVPHYNAVSRMYNLREIGVDLVLSPRISPSLIAIERWIDKIVSSKFILTNSLHGAIISYAYGKPFAYFSDGFLDCPFKWHDFSESIGVPFAIASTADEGIKLFSDFNSKMRKFWIGKLLSTCPYTVIGSRLISRRAGNVFL